MGGVPEQAALSGASANTGGRLLAHPCGRIIGMRIMHKILNMMGRRAGTKAREEPALRIAGRRRAVLRANGLRARLGARRLHRACRAAHRTRPQMRAWVAADGAQWHRTNSCTKERPRCEAHRRKRSVSWRRATRQHSWNGRCVRHYYSRRRLAVGACREEQT